MFKKRTKAHPTVLECAFFYAKKIYFSSVKPLIFLMIPMSRTWKRHFIQTCLDFICPWQISSVTKEAVVKNRIFLADFIMIIVCRKGNKPFRGWWFSRTKKSIRLFDTISLQQKSTNSIRKFACKSLICRRNTLNFDFRLSL